MRKARALDIRPLDGWDEENILAISRMHKDLLPSSSISGLGIEFMTRCYYRLLPRDGFISGAVAYWNSEPVGFVSYTTDSRCFMGRAFRRYWRHFFGTLLAIVVVRPSSLREAVRAVRIWRNTPAGVVGENMGELLSFGVRRRKPRGAGKIAEPAGVSTALHAFAIQSLRRCGVSKIRAVVDADNREACMFYSLMGWRQTGASLSGWRNRVVEYSITLE